MVKKKQSKKEGKISKKIISNVIVCLLVACIVSVIGVGAATLFASSDVIYDNTNSGAVSTDVQGALDELYELANNPEYYDPYAVGTEVYYNPETGAKCFDYVSTNSENENNTGCMKWYIIGEDTDTIDMILDHNTTYTSYWNSQGYTDKGPEEITNELDLDTMYWTGVPARTDSYTDPAIGYTISYNGLRARLIEANEIAKITGADKALGWDSATSVDFYYLDGKYGTNSEWSREVATSQGASKYAWLYDYTGECTIFGCNIDEFETFGYWTSSASAGDSFDAWGVYYDGKVFYNAVDHDLGLRPVITISKF